MNFAENATEASPSVPATTPPASVGDPGPVTTITPAAGSTMDQQMLDSFAKFPAVTKGSGNPDGTKQFNLTAAITD